MDMSGKRRVPDRCWVEFRSADGGLLASVPALNDGAQIRFQMPAFPDGVLAREQICSETDGKVIRSEPGELEPLPRTEGMLQVIQYG